MLMFAHCTRSPWNPAIVLRLLSYWRLDSLIALGRVNHFLRGFILIYSQEAWSLDRHFAQWFPDPQSFRVALSESNAIVVGSQIVRFLDRAPSTNQKIQILVPLSGFYLMGTWLGANGYTYKPEDGDYILFSNVAANLSQTAGLIIDGIVPKQSARIPSLLTSVTFARVNVIRGCIVHDLIQLVAVSRNPIHHVLEFRTSTSLLI